MGTAYTSNGLPYPDGSDPVKSGDNKIGELAAAVLPDWSDPSWLTGWVALSAYPAKYRIIGDQWVVLSGSAYYSGGIPNLSSVLKLPRGIMADDTSPYAAGANTFASNRSGTWAAANAYLDLRANGTIVCHLTPVSGVDCLHLDGVQFRIKKT